MRVHVLLKWRRCNQAKVSYEVMTSQLPVVFVCVTWRVLPIGLSNE